MEKISDGSSSDDSQLGWPTFFMTLICVDLRRSDLAEIISKVNRLDLSAEDIESMNYFERCNLFNKNPVLVAPLLKIKSRRLL